MEILTYILITLVAFAGMEFMAWFTHKYIMHGLLWDWHRVHHQPQIKGEGFFEKNDLFFLIYAVPSMLLYMGGSLTEYRFLLFIGIGISLYGLVYFLVHDVYIHNRLKWFTPSDSLYSRAIIRAHGTHHSKQTKENCESFGLLVIHPKFLRNAFKSKKSSS